jgi:type IV secretion system protein VirB10
MAPASTPPADVTSSDIRPRIRLGKRSLYGNWLFAGGIAIAAVALFTALEAHRTVADLAANQTADSGTSRISSPPDLELPPGLGPQPPQPTILVPAQPAPSAETAPAPARTRASRPPRAFPPQPVAIPYVPPMQQPVYVAPIQTAPQSYAGPNGAGRQDRVIAYQFANAGTTVPKGTIIQAVLETALDSTRPGFARALVSRDITSFDGRRVLIPRGSRLVGEYAADLGGGQNRIVIEWQRLMRPDGVAIDLVSPSSDSLGRAGVKGGVNSHFGERLGNALLQSLVSIGPQLLLRRSATGVIYAGPVANQVAPAVAGDRVQRTLTLKAGSSVSVFVAKDLDFSSVGR